jgi:hypothetical protein
VGRHWGMHWVGGGCWLATPLLGSDACRESQTMSESWRMPPHHAGVNGCGDTARPNGDAGEGLQKRRRCTVWLYTCVTVNRIQTVGLDSLVSHIRRGDALK